MTQILNPCKRPTGWPQWLQALPFRLCREVGSRPWLRSACLALFLTEPVYAGEVLQHLSDETDVTPVVSQPVKADRRITYRVLCAPGDDLPDCEQPVDDAEANQSVHEIAVPDMPPDAADLAEAEEKTPAITETKPMPANKAVANKGGKTPRAVKPATEKNKKKTVKAPTAKKPVSKKTDKKKNK